VIQTTKNTMSNPRSCKKCGHLHLQATHAELEACPECGAIYSRVEAAIKEGKFTAFTQPIPKPAPPPPQPKAVEPTPQAAAPIAPPTLSAPKQIDTKPYIEVLREQSNYPNFRAFVNFCTGFGYLVAAVLCIGGLLTRNLSGATIGICSAIFIVIISKFGKESFSMLADLSDSAAIIAENSRQK
jgi:predicted RNA-binding Zn-ribbon protein involved in translation (DUF1610 family)